MFLRPLCAVLILILCLAYTPFVVHGQPSHKSNNDPNTHWADKLYKTWELVDIKSFSTTFPEFRKYTDKSYVYLRLNKNGSDYIFSDDIMVGDSFMVFEKQKAKYIDIDGLMFKIKRVTDDVLELTLHLPGKELDAVNIRFIATPGTSGPAIPSFIRSWRQVNGPKKYSYDYYSDYAEENTAKRLLTIRPDGSYSQLKDTLLTTGKWIFNPEIMQLKLMEDHGKPQIFIMKTFEKMGMGLMDENDSIISFMSSYKDADTVFKYRKSSQKQMHKKPSYGNGSIGDVTGEYSPPREVVEPPPPPTVENKPAPRYLTNDEILVNGGELKAELLEDLETSVKRTEEVVLQFNADNTYTLQYGKKKTSGTWKRNRENESQIILESKGQQQLCPMTMSRTMSNKVPVLLSVRISMVLPGDKKVSILRLKPVVSPQGK